MLRLVDLSLPDTFLSKHAKTVAGVSVVTILIWRVASKCLQNYFVRRFTVNHDLRTFGVSRAEEKRIKGTAVICGGSIAGLWAARVCLDHFEDVVIVEPEAWLGTEIGAKPPYNEIGALQGERHERARVLQYNAGHGFQVTMLTALRKAFPNCDELLKKYGGRIETAEHHVHLSGTPVPSPWSDYPKDKFPDVLYMTRESFEIVLRQLVRSHSSRLRWVTGTVTSLKPNEKDSTKVSGVTIRTDQGEADMEINADLVLDCTGGTCAGFKWLKRWAKARSPGDDASALDDLRNTYHPHIHSVTFRYVVPPALRKKLPLPGGYDNALWLYTFSANPDIESRVFLASRIEGHRIEVLFGSWGDQDLPTKPAQLRGCFESIRTEKPLPEWLLNTAEMLSEVEDCAVFTCAVPPCYWIHYENAPRLPSNFVVLGDALMRVNPVFGQGCTKACLDAVTLDAMLRRAPSLGPNFSNKFFSMDKDRVGGLWDGTKPTDYGYSTTEPMKGETLEDGRYARKFARFLVKLITKDKFVNSALWHVRMMMAPTTDLMHPYILFRAAIEAMKERIGLS